MTTISVIVATYGNFEIWNSFATVAMNSVKKQTVPPSEIIRYHGESVHQCRNMAASRATSKYLIFLDGDDELEPDYVEEMGKAVTESTELLYPRVRYVSENVKNPIFYPEPRTLAKVDIYRGNYMVIGTMVPRKLFESVGGFRDYDAYEDWDLWIRCIKAGAESRLVKDAIYLARTRTDGRNRHSKPRDVIIKILTDNGVNLNTVNKLYPEKHQDPQEKRRIRREQDKIKYRIKINR